MNCLVPSSKFYLFKLSDNNEAQHWRSDGHKCYNNPKFNVGLKSLLYQGLSEPELYGDLVYKFKKIMGRTDVSDQIRHKRIGYDLNVMRQSACLVINPFTVDNFAALFNCTPVDRAPDSLMARPKDINLVGRDRNSFVCCLAH